MKSSSVTSKIYIAMSEKEELSCGCNEAEACTCDACEQPPVGEAGEQPEAPAELSWEEKCAEAQDKYLRLVAEFDNYRKRTARERLELVMTAGEDVITGLLGIVDDF